MKPNIKNVANKKNLSCAAQYCLIKCNVSFYIDS